MGQRIPISIYQLPAYVIEEDLKDLLKRTAGEYLLNISDADVITSSDGKSKTVYITKENFVPNDHASISSYVDRYFQVHELANKKLYVIINGKSFFIYSANGVFSTFGGKSVQSYIKTLGKEAFTFYVNPERVTPSFQKLQTEVRTLGGYEIQHWGNQLTTLKVDARTGGMNKIRVLEDGKYIYKGLDVKTQSIMESDAWKRVVELRRLYEVDHSRRNAATDFLLAMNYMDGLYIGYFVDFMGPVAEADHPYIMSFSFTFKVQETIYSSGMVSIPGDMQYEV